MNQMKTFRRKNTAESESGMTLLELMIGISIIAILSMVAIPNFIGMRDSRMLKNAARGLIGDMQKARMGAIKDNQNWSIVFQPGTGYQIFDNGGASLYKTVNFTGKKTGVSYGKGDATSPIGATFNGVGGSDYITYGGDILTFNPNGTCNAGYVYLANKKGDVFGVGTLSSGVVILKQWMGSGWSD